MIMQRLTTIGAFALTVCALIPAVAANDAELGALSFIEDDYDRALAEARARDVPVFIDSWAPW